MSVPTFTTPIFPNISMSKQSVEYTSKSANYAFFIADPTSDLSKIKPLLLLCLMDKCSAKHHSSKERDRSLFADINLRFLRIQRDIKNIRVIREIRVRIKFLLFPLFDFPFGRRAIPSVGLETSYKNDNPTKGEQYKLMQ